MKLSRNELLNVVKEFCATAPTKRVCPSTIYKDRVEVKIGQNGATLALFSATSNGRIRITRVLDVDKKFLIAAGVKNNRLSLEVKPLSLEEGFNQITAKFNALYATVKPHIDAYYAGVEVQDKAEAKLLHEIGAYGVTPSAKVFREKGDVIISYLNSDGTMDIKLNRIDRETLNAVLAVLGNPVLALVSDEYARENETSLSVEEWNALPKEAKQAYRQLAFEELYGKKN